MKALTVDQWVTISGSTLVMSIFLFFSLVIYPFREWTEETRKRSRSFISNALFREFWYFIMGPFKRRLLAWNVAPNTLTTLGLFFSWAAGAAYAFGCFGTGGWLVILASTCDVYDGMLARAKKISLKSGAFFDSCLDRIGEVGMFYGLMWHYRQDAFWMMTIFLALSSSQVVSYARARAEGLGFQGGNAFFQRAERMIVLSIGTCLAPILAAFVNVDLFDKVAHATILILAAGSLQTAFVRTHSIYKLIRSTESH